MKIILLDDHPLILNALESEITKAHPHLVISKFTTIEKAETFIKTNSVQFVICDLEIVSGKSTVIPELCYQNQIPYMVYSSHTNKTLIHKLQTNGLSIYVSKASSQDELQMGIKALINSQSYFCSILREVMQSDTQELDTEPLSASKTQLKILALLNSGFTQVEVAQKLNLSLRTVINHLAILRNNNACKSTAELLRRYSFWAN